MPRSSLITVRRDTAANWSSVNPILASGELGYDTTTPALKIGDGATAWNSLSAIGGGGSSDFSLASLASDLALSITVNNYNDVTGLGFAVTANKTYYFKAGLVYHTGNTSIGSRWSINGPAATFMSYRSEYTLTSASSTINANNTAYDTPASSNATSGGSAGNFCFLEGFVKPSASGNIIVRGGIEIVPGTLTIKQGSFIQYRQID